MTCKESLSEKWITALFARLRGIYMDKWDRCFHSEEELAASKFEWSEGLAGMDGDAIKRAIEHCRLNIKWPPSIAEFVEAGKIARQVHDPLLPKPPKVKPDQGNIDKVHAMIKDAFKGVE